MPCMGLVNYDMLTGLDQEKYGGYYTDPFDETKKINKAQQLTFRFIKSHLKSSDRAIDIGCGNGKLLHLLKQQGWEVKGLELSSLLADSIKKILNIDVEVADFLSNNNEELGLFDLVTLRHVLEHLPEPVLAMKKINSFLNLGGHAVLEFPNIEALDLKFKRFLQRNNIRQKKYREDYVPGHCNEYSKHSFEYLAEKSGFEVVLFETYTYNPVKNFLYNRIPIGDKARTIIRKISGA
jgi:2-polyprenyl-3-methyl-5-hydroxy-6-metoxy-1,4-benzoquinol methylase